MFSKGSELIERRNELMECEGLSCSFNPELITPKYVYRMWGGKVPFEQIEEAVKVNGSRLMVKGYKE